MQVKKLLLEPCMEQLIGSGLRKRHLYAEHIVRNAQLDELQVGIKIGGRNINNLRYADDSTLIEGRKEELKSLLRVKEGKSQLKARY